MTSRMIFREETFTIELLTPLHIGSGEPDGTSDAGVVRDFNGLPGIPGTSLQGALRAAAEECLSPQLSDGIFGWAGSTARKKADGSEDNGRGGRLWVSWGVVHNQKNQPQRTPITPSFRDADPVLRDASRPMLRDHVRLNGRGVADTEKRGKFDELVVSAGHRFTFKLRFATARSQKEADDDWSRLQKILLDPALRLGGKSRRGLGAFKVINRNGDEITRSESGQIARTEIRKLTPETFWMFGGGLSEDTDSAPVSGYRIIWNAGGNGTAERVWVIPGSGVKGALAHRTRFHANRLARNFIGKPEKQDIEPWMVALFGTEKGTAVAGKVFINDLFIPKTGDDLLADVQNHVAVSPFTGGAKDSALFDDQPLRPEIATVELRVDVQNSVSEPKSLEAFKAALDELSEGQLSLGAHAGRGYGFFKEGRTKPQ